MSAFFHKKSVFFGKNRTFTQSNSERLMLEIFLVLFSVFVRWKVTFDENVSFTDYASGIRLRDGFKLVIHRKNSNGITICWHEIIVNFFVSLVNLSYWSKFHVIIITASGVMLIFFNKGLARNPEIENTLVWVLPNIWRLEWVGDNKLLLNTKRIPRLQLLSFLSY